MMKTALLTALLATTAMAGAHAETVAALAGDKTLVLIDTSARKAISAIKVDGVSGKLLGIDVRPADGMLYGLMDDGAIVTIAPTTGKATVRAKLDTMLPSGVAATVDFNPVADRLRVIGADGTNLRVNVDDGKVVRDGTLNFAGTDERREMKPAVVAGAYTNSVKGTKETALFDIDASGLLLKQAPPNDGVLNTVGKLGVKGEGVAFDIAADGKGGNAAWLLTNGTLYQVDLASGSAMVAGKISGLPGDVRDIAVMPGM